MTKFLFALLSLSLLLSTSNAIYKHQVGKYDWDIRTIGDIDKVHLQTFKAPFSTKDGFIGSFSTQNGTFFL